MSSLQVATPFKTKSRSCTDIICLLLFLLCLGGWVAVAVIAFKDGDPKKVVTLVCAHVTACSQVLYPTNSRGEVCGQGVFEDKPFMMMFDISR